MRLGKGWGLKGTLGVETRAPPDLVTFHFVHPLNVSTVVLGMNHAALRHLRKTFAFDAERTDFVKMEDKENHQPSRGCMLPRARF